MDNDPFGNPTPPGSHIRFFGRRRPEFPTGRVLAVVLPVLLLGGFGYWWFKVRATDEGPAEMPTIASEIAVPEAPEPVPPLELPPLEESDGFIRQVASRVSAHPQLASWLVTDRLIERFVITIANLSAGASPISQLGFLAPADSFEVEAGMEEGGAARGAAGAAGGTAGAARAGEAAAGTQERIYVAPRTYRRYDLLTETFVSLDTEGSATLYRQLQPLFDESYRDLGFTDSTFEEELERAIRNVLSVEVPRGPVEVVEGTMVYEYADPGLESLDEAEKHILRLGPDNARRVQAKLRDLAAALGLNVEGGAG